MSKADWRRLSTEQRVQSASALGSKIEERYAYGAKTYGLNFEGDPLQELEEELLDALIYLQWAKRQRSHAEGYQLPLL